MTNLKLIGIIGKAHSGKNHTANILKEKLGFLTWAFANPIKMNSYSKVDEWTLDEMFASGEKPKELRRYLQQEGTEKGRDLYRQDLWTRNAEAFLFIVEKEWSHLTSGVIFTDIRFPDEAEFVSKNGGLLIKVNNENSGIQDPSLSSHKSEAYIDSLKADVVLNNTNRPTRDEIFSYLAYSIEKHFNLPLGNTITTGVSFD